MEEQTNLVCSRAGRCSPRGRSCAPHQGVEQRSPPIARAPPSWAADAQKLDKNGKCHAADGKFAKAEVCAGMKPAMAGAYKLDAKGNCHDAKGKMAKKDLCAAKK